MDDIFSGLNSQYNLNEKDPKRRLLRVISRWFVTFHTASLYNDDDEDDCVFITIIIIKINDDQKNYLLQRSSNIRKGDHQER